MRILHIDTGRDMRGGQHQVLLLIEALARHGCSQSLLAGPAISSRRACETSSAWTVRRESRKCDLIHAHDAHAHTLALLYGSGKPIVVARRVAFPIGPGWLSRLKYRLAEHYIAVSKYAADTLRRGGVPAQSISVVYDAAPEIPQPSHGPAAQGDISSGAEAGMRVVALDSSDPLKCRDLAVDACKIAGVELTFADDLLEELPRADALLYLSRSEGLGSAILLAMAHGVPTVASRIDGIPEAVDDGVTGLLVDNDAAAVARAIRQLETEPALRARMGRAALERVQRLFSPGILAEKTFKVYERVLAKAARQQSGARR